MLVLILEPCLCLLISEGSNPEARVEDFEAVVRAVKEETTKICGQPAIGIVETNDDEAALFKAGQNRSQPEVGIARMMQYSVAYHQIDAFGSEYWSK